MDEIDKILEEATEEEKKEIQEYVKEGMKVYEEQEVKKAKNLLELAKEQKNEKQELQKENLALKKMIKKNKEKKEALACLDETQLGVLQRMINDYNSSEIDINVGECPPNNHPIFSHFYELCNNYPSRRLLIRGISDFIDEKKKEIDFELNKQKKNMDILKKCHIIQENNPIDWEDKLTDEEIFLNKVTNESSIQKKINLLEQKRKGLFKWRMVKNDINSSLIKPDKEIKDQQYYEIMEEYKNVYNFVCNLKLLYNNYKPYVNIPKLSNKFLYSALALELSEHLGLCVEPVTHNFFYSDSKGRLVPYKENRPLLWYVQQNFTFVQQLKKKNKYYSGNIINSKDLFVNVPEFVSTVHYHNDDLIGFNNALFDIKTRNILPLHPYAPVLPLKNTKTELYLDKDENGNVIEIEDNPMKTIFYECFTERDRKAFLAYIGCCLYDKGYTQRQESLFLLSSGGTGKTTLIRAICEIFYSWESQLVTKVSDERFGFSLFADNDIVIIDEIQSAKKDFAEILKNISTGSNMVIEKKNVDTFNLPAKNVPRVIFIGNEFPRALYDASVGEGVFRRVLCITPTKPIQSCGFKWDDLISTASKQWIVQQATLEYINQNLDKEDKSIECVSDAEKKKRLEKCTYPEAYFLKEHFEVSYNDNGTIDHSEVLYYDELRNFISNQINEHLLEKTIKESNEQTFIKTVKEALNIHTDYHTKRDSNGIFFTGIVPKSDLAIEQLNN